MSFIKLFIAVVLFTAANFLAHTAVTHVTKEAKQAYHQNDFHPPRLSKPFPLEFSFDPQSVAFYFSDDRMYVGQWRCTIHDFDYDHDFNPYGGEKNWNLAGYVSLEVFDRSTLQSIADIKIRGCVKDSTPYIKSITSDNANIYLSMGMLGMGIEKNNFVVIDKKTMKVIKQIGIPYDESNPYTYEGGPIFYYKGELNLCYPFNHYNRCDALDPTSLQKSSRPTYRLGRLFEIENSTELPEGTDYEDAINEGPEGTDLATPNYFVKGDWASERNVGDYIVGITISSKDGKTTKHLDFSSNPPSSVKVYRFPKRDALFYVRVSPAKNAQSQSTLTYADFASGVNKDFATLNANFSISTVTADGKYIFVGNGNDLYIYSLNDFQLKKYIKDLTYDDYKCPDCLQNEFRGHGWEYHTIQRLIVDGNHLFVMTGGGGQEARVLNLKELGLE